MNSVILVGRLTSEPEIVDLTDDMKRTVINIAVQRGYKNPDGIYETDFIKCVLWNGIASATKEYCHKGDIVGIKGRLQTRIFSQSETAKKYVTEVIADKVSFLQSKTN